MGCTDKLRRERLHSNLKYVYTYLLIDKSIYLPFPSLSPSVSYFKCVYTYLLIDRSIYLPLLLSISPWQDENFSNRVKLATRQSFRMETIQAATGNQHGATDNRQRYSESIAKIRHQCSEKEPQNESVGQQSAK